MDKIKEILQRENKEELRELFSFTVSNADKEIELKFNLWARYFFPKFFKSTDAPFHKDIDINNIRAYKGDIRSFVNIVFRGGAKTTRTKLFFAYAICCDKEHSRRYLKILSKDPKNATQSTTDIYNMLIDHRLSAIFPEIFKKTPEKREETMGSFTTATGVKLTAGSVGTDQRGQLQDESRPDFIWFDDFETRKTLRSAVETKAIWDNMEEARTGLSKNGASIYTCNYVSERGNVHKLVEKKSDYNIVLIVPIIEENTPTWDRYTVEEIKQIKHDADDFEGEYLCKPSASKDVFFDRESIDKQEKKEPVKEVNGFKMFYDFDPSHRYGSGHDIAGGVGLDSSTSVVIDFDTVPARVVGTYRNNLIKPDALGDEIYRQGEYFNYPLCAPEINNHGHATVGRLKQLYPLYKLFRREDKDTKVEEETKKEYGWHTNALTKPKMLSSLAKAIEDGLIALSDEELIAEARSYTRNDLMEKEPDARLTTRHFDLLMACAIAWQLKDHVEYDQVEEIGAGLYDLAFD